MRTRVRHLSSLLALVVLLASAGVAQALPSLSTATLDPWLAAAPDVAALQTALTTAADKLPVEFDDRLAFVRDDGTLQVMVTLDRRDPETDAWVADHTEGLHWYGDDPRFYGRITQAQLLALLTDPRVRFVEPDYPITDFQAESTVDIHARSLTGDGTGVWSFDPDADPTQHPYGALRSDVDGLSVDQATGKGVVVAITDSGVDRTHKDFGAFDCDTGPYGTNDACPDRILATVTVEHLLGPEFGDLEQPFPTTEISSGHGTHVAGTIAGNGFYARDGEADPSVYGADGRVFGVAPQSSIVSVKNGDSSWAGLSSIALQWQLDNAERLGIRVSSNSWGCLGGCAFDPNSVTAQIVHDLYDAGVVVAFAVGNDDGGPDGAAFSGNAQSPYVLGVAAYDDASDRLADFSSRGRAGEPLPEPSTWDPDAEPAMGYRRPDLAAPGVSTWSARTLTGGSATLIPRVTTSDVTGGPTNGIRPYAQLSGTSMATPHVAGAAALLFGACPDAGPLDVMRALLVGVDADRILSTDGSRQAEPYEDGYGALNVRAGLDWLLGLSVCGGSGNLTPSASITGPATVSAGSPTTFDGSASGDPDGTITTFAWGFGDGATATGPVVEHTYETPGTYTVSLQVTDDAGATAVATHQVTVVGEAITIETPADGSTLEPGTVDVTGVVDRPQGGGGTLLLVGDGTSGTTQIDPSSFAMSSAGDAGPETSYTTVGPLAVDSWDNVGMPTFLAPEPVELSGDTVTLTVDVEYAFPDNEVALSCPLVAQLFDAQGNPLGPTAQTVVQTAPGEVFPATFTFSPRAGAYDGLGVQVSTIGVDCGSFPATWYWGGEHAGRLTLADEDTLVDGPLGPGTEQVALVLDDATEPFATVEVETANADHRDRFTAAVELAEGEHTITATWTDADGRELGSATSNVSVAAPNTAPTATIDAPTAADAGTEVVLDGSASTDPDGTVAGWMWDFGDGTPAAQGATVRHVFAEPGTYTVTLVVTDDRGGTGSAQATIDVVEAGPADGYQRVFADLSNVDCGADSWRFQLQRIDAAHAPTAVTVTWTDGTTEDVPLDSVRGQTAFFETTSHAGGEVEQAYTDVPELWDGHFRLQTGRC